MASDYTAADTKCSKERIVDRSRSSHSNAHDLNVLLRLLFVRLGVFDLVYDVQPLHRTSKNSMFTVQPRCLLRRDEELTAVGVGSRIRHGECIRLVMLQA